MDDHTKNFSFLMRNPDSPQSASAHASGWELAPAYDLTGYHFSVADRDFEAWSNPHVLSVNGKTGNITDADQLLVAERFGIGTAKRVLAEIKGVVAKEAI